MKTLITATTGFIGFNLAKAMFEHCCEVTELDNFRRKGMDFMRVCLSKRGISYGVSQNNRTNFTILLPDVQSDYSKTSMNEGVRKFV